MSSVKRIRHQRRCPETLESRCLLAGDLLISEFMALNTGTLQDEDGEFSDWIEIYNNDSVSHALHGWHLTNDLNNPAKWTFPNGISLKPGEFLRVFASGKNRKQNLQQLHTSFDLDHSGGDLAIVSPVLQVEHEYAAYPLQVANVSYGLAMPETAEFNNVLLPTVDTWVRETDPDRSYENDAMHVATPEAEGEDRWGVVEWNLSGIDQIVAAHMEFARRSRGLVGDIQIAFEIEPGIQGITYNRYLDTKLDTEMELDGLGAIDVEFDLPLNAYVSSSSASAADLTRLNNARTTSGDFAVVLKADNGSFEWHDGPNQGGPGFGGVDLPIRLVLQESIPRIATDDFRFFTNATPNQFNVEGAQTLSTGVFITEFLAVNQNGIQDEDGDAFGWVELFNNDGVVRDISGWHLSDEQTDLGKWTFPAGTTIEAGQFLRIFTSGKNRLASDSLHTNFQLPQQGGYLGLSDDTNNVIHEYLSYPEQLIDVSYGIVMPDRNDSDSITLPADVDTWVRESDPHRSYENDAMWIAEPSVFGENRWGVAEWDLSSVDQTIIDAHMSFSPRTRADVGAVQEAYTIAHDITGLTWNEYLDIKLDTEEPLDSLGFITVPDSGIPFNTYADGDSASQDDLLLLNEFRTGSEKFTVVFKASQGALEWNDGANRGGGGFQSDIPVHLVLMVDAPFIPVELDLSLEVFFVSVTPGDDNVGGAQGLTAGVFITEFMARNNGELRDEDGDSSDWIEIYNATPNTVNLSGWHLTDAAATKDKWSFPENTTLSSGEFVIVFASDKDRATTGSELHTNFKLSSNGEYLGLVDADLNVRHEYIFPEQFDNISYGIGMESPQVDEEVDPPAPAGALYRVDFDDESGTSRMMGNEALAAAASFRFDHNSGEWNSPTVPHHEGGFGGIDFFSKTLVDSNGENPIEWTHLDGDPVRANNPGVPDAVHGDFWFLTVDTFVDWELTGLEPKTEYEMFHYGGWGPSTPDDERITIFLDTDGDGDVDTSQEAGLSTGGPAGTHFPSIITDHDGRILGRWESAPGVPSWADTAGFQLARINNGVGQPAPLPGIPINIDNIGYLTTETPADFNISEVVDGFVDDTVFDVDRGFFSEPLNVSISTRTADAKVYYTLDGSEPNPLSESSILFDAQAPIPIKATTVLRAAAFKERFQPSNIDTQSYFFLDDVVTQNINGGTPKGWPAANVGGQVFDYGMDPDIVNDPVWGPQIRTALESLTTFSIVTDLKNLVDPSTGIYVNAGGQGKAWERPASVEFLHPDGTQGFQVNAGIRPRGNFSASGSNPKHAFRLFFREEYGDRTLQFPLFGDEGVDAFKNLDLRTAQNDSWPFQASSQYTFVHDVFSRDNQAAMGQPYTRSRYHHLYINGIYWGLFQSQERSEADYGASYFGGDAQEYDVIKSSGGPQYQTEVTDGNFNAWRALWEGLQAGVEDDEDYMKLQGLNLDGSRNPEFPILLDVDNLIDYMIDIFYTGDEDRGLSRPLQNNRPNNFFALRHRNGNHGFQFFSQDAEQSMLSLHNVEGRNANRLGPFIGSNRNNFTYSNPQWMHQDLLANEQYRRQFQDHVHLHFFNDGVFTVDVAKERFLSRARELDPAIVAESARWGDAHPNRTNRPLTKNDWQRAIDRMVDRFLDHRTDIVLNQFRDARRESPNGLVDAPLYPDVAAPVFHQHGGFVEAGFQLSIDQVGGTGTIYYTTDGHDPRHYDPQSAETTIAVSAKDFEVNPPPPFTSTTVVKSRVLDNGEWSALNEALFIVETAPGIVISEINFNPYPPTTAEIEVLGDLDNEEFEFVEILNAHPSEIIHLGGFSFSDGVEFEFPVETLVPGERAVVVENMAAFQQRYGSQIRILGQWTGGLSNNGERLTIDDGSGGSVLNFEYRDNNPWPVSPDLVGTTLQLIDPNNTPVDQMSKHYRWRASSEIGGSPGSQGVDPIGIIINEVLAHTDPPVTEPDSIELFNPTGQEIDVSGWYLSDSSNHLQKYRIPVGTMIQAGGYRVFDESDFNPTPVSPGRHDFALSGANGDDVWLVIADANDVVTTVVDDAHFGASPNGESFGRVPNGIGRFAPMSFRTFDGPNSEPRIGPVIISEINYQPGSPSDAAQALYPELTSDDLEFVELYNPTATEVDLTNWRLRGGIDHELDSGLTIQARSTLVLTPFNPDNQQNSARADAFRTHFGIPEDTKLAGGFTGQLNDRGERIQLQRPDEPPIEDPNLIPRLWEDEVVFDDLTPWPQVDGNGQSISRHSVRSFGSDATSWQATAPTPGRFDESLLGDFNDDGVVDVIDVDLLSAGIRADDNLLDLTGDDQINQADLRLMIKVILGTHFGDANLDGIFNSGDLVRVFQVGEYENEIAGDSTWADGDWTADGEFGTADLVIAFQDGGFTEAAVGAEFDRTNIPAIETNHPTTESIPMKDRVDLIFQRNKARKDLDFRMVDWIFESERKFELPDREEPYQLGNQIELFEKER